MEAKTPNTFWACAESERLVYAQARRTDFLTELPEILRASSLQGVAATADEGAIRSEVVTRFLMGYNGWLRDLPRYRNIGINLDWIFSRWPDVRSEIKAAASEHSTEVEHQVAAAIAFLDGEDHSTLPGAMNIVIKAVAEGNHNWQQHKAALQRVFPHVLSLHPYGGFSGSTLQHIWDCPCRLELLTLLCSAFSYVVLPDGERNPGIFWTLRESINNQRCPYAWRSFILVIVMTFTLRAAQENHWDRELTDRLNGKWHVDGVFDASWEDFHNADEYFLPFLAEVPAPDKGYVEAIICMIWLVIFELEPTRYGDGVSYFSDSLPVPSQAAWDEMRGSVFYQRRFEWLLDCGGTAASSCWDAWVQKGLVNVHAARQAWPRNMVRALQYTERDVKSVFFQTKQFWSISRDIA